MPGPFAGGTVDLDRVARARERAADQPERHRQAELPGSGSALRRAADTNPDRQRLLERPRRDRRVVQRRAEAAGPAHAFVLAQREQQPQLLVEEGVVVLEALAEERERFDEGAAADGQLGSAAADEVELGEVLVDALGRAPAAP